MVENKQLKKRIIYMIIFIVGGVLLSHSNNYPRKFIEYIILVWHYKEDAFINIGALTIMIAVWISGAKLIGELQWNILKKVRRFIHPFVR